MLPPSLINKDFDFCFLEILQYLHFNLFSEHRQKIEIQVSLGINEILTKPKIFEHKNCVFYSCFLLLLYVIRSFPLFSGSQIVKNSNVKTKGLWVADHVWWALIHHGRCRCCTYKSVDESVSFPSSRTKIVSSFVSLLNN